MKKLLLGVITFALIITSCNKYANDFQALKDQIAALSLKVDGVAALQSQLTATTAQISALQTAVAALPTTGGIAAQFATISTSLSAVSDKVAALTATLATVAATGTATQTTVNGLAATLAQVVKDKATADAALNAKIDALQTSLQKSIADGAAANSAAIAAAQTEILKQVVASSMATNDTVKQQIAAAELALQNLINTGLANTNANVTSQVADAKKALSDLVTASVATLKTDLQKSIADGLDVTNSNVNNKIADLTTALNVGLAGVDANTKTLLDAAQKAVIDLLTSNNTNLNTKIDNVSSALTDLINSSVTSVNGNTNSQINSLQILLTGIINTMNTTLGNKITTLQTTLVGNPSTDTATSLTIAGLQLALGNAQRDLTILLNASAMYNDNVTITTDSEVGFYLGKLYQMGIINGNVTVNTTNLSADTIKAVNKILGAINAVIGTNTATQVITAGTHHSWWGGGSWVITTVPGSGHSVSIESDPTDMLALPLLFSVRGDYSVAGADVNDPKIDNVGGSVILNYPGAYESTSLTSVGQDLILNSVKATTTNINFPNVVIGGHVGDHIFVAPATPNGTVVFSADGTSSITFGLATGGQINSLTAANAKTISLGTIGINAAGLTVVAPVALTVNLSSTTSSVGAITLATGASASTGTATSVDLSKLVTSGTLTVWAAAAGNVALDSFNSASSVDIEGPLALSIPVWLGQPGSKLNAPLTQTLTLAMYRWWSVTDGTTIPSTANLAAIQTLTLGNALENVNIQAYPTLVKAVITGAAFGDATHWATLTAHAPGVTTANSPNLTWLELAGIMNTVNVSTLPKLTAVKTSGIINTFVLDNADALLALQLDHAHFNGAIGYGGPGSDLWITGNAKLASVTTTALDKMNSLKITNNALLTTLNLGSYVNPINTVAFTVSIEVFNNKLAGTFSPALAQFGTTPYREAKITCATLTHLRDYVAILDAVPGSAYSVFTVDVDNSVLIDNPLPGETVGTAYKLGVEMGLNDAVSTVIDGTYGISKNAEFQLVQ